MHKALTQMNIQLNHVISDITGMTGINIIKAILQGERDPIALANLSVAGCRKNMGLIAKSLEGNYRKEHLFSLKQSHEAYEFFHEQIHKCEMEIQNILKNIQEKQVPCEAERSVAVRMEKEEEQLEKALKKLSLEEFACQHDAKEALKRFSKKAKFYKVVESYIEEQKKYQSRGRPNSESPYQVIYRITGVLEEREGVKEKVIKQSS